MFDLKIIGRNRWGIYAQNQKRHANQYNGHYQKYCSHVWLFATNQPASSVYSFTDDPNNHYAGFGPGTVNTFRNMLGLPESKWEDRGGEQELEEGPQDDLDVKQSTLSEFLD
jgi:hypothetical protein